MHSAQPSLFTISSFVALALVASAPTYATDSAQQLLQANSCLACHAEKMKLVGPAFAWVAYRFKGKKNAVETVADFIINGGVGYWKPWTGAMPMPSHPNLTKDQARTIARWILSLPPSAPPAP